MNDQLSSAESRTFRKPKSRNKLCRSDHRWSVRDQKMLHKSDPGSDFSLFKLVPEAEEEETNMFFFSCQLTDQFEAEESEFPADLLSAVNLHLKGVSALISVCLLGFEERSQQLQRDEWRPEAPMES